MKGIQIGREELSLFAGDMTLYIENSNVSTKKAPKNLLELINEFSKIAGYKSNIQKSWDFPGGTVVKNPPANEGDTGSTPGLGRSHMLWSNYACAPQLPSLLSRAHEPQLLKPTHLEPVLRNKRSHRNKKPMHRNEE